jgi:hypothetical protein
LHTTRFFGRITRWSAMFHVPALVLLLVPAGDQVTSTPACLERSHPPVTISGLQPKRWIVRDLPDNTVIDARSAQWIGAADSPVRWGGGDDLCWTGGVVKGLYPETDSWSRLHDTKAMRVGQTGGVRATIEGFRAINYGDGISLEDGAEDFLIRGVHLTHMRDDCVENDFARGGRIEDSFFEGCYVWIATRPRPSSAARVDGSSRRLVIARNVAWMEPMATVYSGPAPSTSAVFKVDRSPPSVSPRMILRHNVLRVDVAPGVGDACLDPEGLVIESVGNVVVWLGEGEYPCLPLPEGWSLTRDRAVWERAVAEWKTRHPAP